MRVDRPKAAMLGMTVTERGHDHPDQRRRYHRRAVPRSAATSTRSSSGCASRTAQEVGDVGDVLLSTPSGQVIPAKNVMADRPRERARCRSSARTRSAITRVNAETEVPLSDAVEERAGAPRPGSRAAGLHGRLRHRGRGTGQVVPAAADGADPRDPAGLRGDGVAVRVAARPVHHHVLDPGRRDRRRRLSCCSPARRSACRPTSASSCWPASSSATRSCWSTTSTRCGTATTCRCAKRWSSAAAPACGRF